MGRILIGAGGWAYFRVPGESSLEAYSRAFDFVEVNSTFYSYPSISLVRSWRSRVPNRFEFSVRCHRDLTHRLKLNTTEPSFKVLDRMLSICKALGAGILHLQTPPRLRLGKRETATLNDLISYVNTHDVRPAIEIRGQASPAFMRMMGRSDAIHCVDISKETPDVETDVLYSRLFGKGEGNAYQFSDGELKEINSKAENLRFEESILAFHGVRMYGDAARLKVYRDSGQMPLATGERGASSLRKVLTEDASFPVSKTDLIRSQGWKLVDISRDVRVRVEELLQKMPDRTFRDVDEVVRLAGL